jgi:hypothetical protein
MLSSSNKTYQLNLVIEVGKKQSATVSGIEKKESVSKIFWSDKNKKLLADFIKWLWEEKKCQPDVTAESNKLPARDWKG